MAGKEAPPSGRRRDRGGEGSRGPGGVSQSQGTARAKVLRQEGAPGAGAVDQDGGMSQQSGGG
jgi:hypothetical protein